MQVTDADKNVAASFAGTIIENWGIPPLARAFARHRIQAERQVLENFPFELLWNFLEQPLSKEAWLKGYDATPALTEDLFPNDTIQAIWTAVLAQKAKEWEESGIV